tara:strand:+ start:351 stop:899 length:549 start_codon:yes stop_codon:yes gene_type:complete
MRSDIVCAILISIICFLIIDCKLAIFPLLLGAFIVYHENNSHIYQKRIVPGSSISASMAQTLKKVDNPQYKQNKDDTDDSTKEENISKKQESDPMPRISSNYSHKNDMYSPKSQEKKYDEMIFNPEMHLRQSADSRARLLNSMYSDLLNESVKKDPYLRGPDDKDACQMKRGIKTVSSFMDC